MPQDGDFVKRDRVARLIRVVNLLFNNPRGLTAREIAQRADVTVRTTYRDLRVLQLDAGIPLWKSGTCYRVYKTEFLPPLRLTLQEAVALFMSARLMARYQDRHDPPAVRAFDSLAAILPAPIARYVNATVASLAARPRDETRERIFEILVTAWGEGRKVRIWYPVSPAQDEKRVSERTLSPYFIEPNPGGHTRYVIGHDSYRNDVRTFKVERIQQARLTDQQFCVPEDFDVAEYFGHAWGIVDEDLIVVRLRFHDRLAAERARESLWHHSQREVLQPDGTLDLEFEVGGFLEMTPWILGWGDTVEVLAPPELRERIAGRVRALAARYDQSPPHGR